MIPVKQNRLSLLRNAVAKRLGLAVAVSFWFIIAFIAVVATAQSEKRWDTLIAALAMGSQAFFAAAVWKLSKNQFAFTQQVSERQNKIDMYPLRKVANRNLETAGKVLSLPPALTDDIVEAFRLSHVEISHLFSDQAGEISFNLYQLVEQAHIMFLRAPSKFDFLGGVLVPGDATITAAAQQSLDEAHNLLMDLENVINREMLIR